MTTFDTSRESFDNVPPPSLEEGPRSEQAQREGPVARAIERQTARLPSDTFLWLAGGSILGSLALKAKGRDQDALFVGQWAPTFLLLGIYNKIVKVAGHGEHDR